MPAVGRSWRMRRSAPSPDTSGTDDSPPPGDGGESGPPLQELTVNELKGLLNTRGLSTSGRKAELIARLEGDG